MAQKVVMVDDLEGTEGARTIRFGVDGNQYEIDLNEKNQARLNKALEKFLSVARPVHRVQKTQRKAGPSYRPADVRAWAAENGVEVSDRGRVPQEVVDRYVAATS